MRRSSARGQVEPLAALVAVAAVCTGLTIYVGAVLDARPDPAEPELAETVLDRLAAASGEVGVLVPAALADYQTHLPAGYAANVTLRTNDERVTAGPAPPESSLVAARDVSVRLGPARIEPARLRVVIWT